jgi:hypothetical protein
MSKEEIAERKEILEIDKAIKESLEESNKAEAKIWLKEKNHIVFEGSKEQAIKLTDDFYSAGSPMVYVSGIETMDDVEIIAHITVLIPEDKEKRKKVFEIEASFMKDIGENPTKDYGQKYFSIAFD